MARTVLWGTLASLLLLLTASPTMSLDTGLNSAGQSLQDLHGSASSANAAVSTPTRVTNPILALMEPALPALKYFIPLVALLALPDLLRTLGLAGLNAAGFGGNARSRRSVPPIGGGGFVEGAQQMLTLMSRVDEALLRYHRMDEGPCRLRALCELHRNGLGPQLGAVAKNLLNVLRADSRVQRSAIPDDTKSAIRDFLRAAEYGLDHQNCAKIYADCPEVPTERRKPQHE